LNKQQLQKLSLKLLNQLDMLTEQERMLLLTLL
jgi:hypothetical protein